MRFADGSTEVDLPKKLSSPAGASEVWLSVAPPTPNLYGLVPNFFLQQQTLF